MKYSSVASEHLSELADGVLALAREIEFQHGHEGFIPLNANELLVLRALDRMGEASPSDLAAKLGLQRPNLSTAVRHLESQGLVTREDNRSDGRGKVVRSTPKAAKQLEELKQRWVELLMPVLPPDVDVAKYAAAVQAMAAALLEQRGHVH